MKRRARTVLLVLSSALAAGLLALFIWLPWNPFEADAGPLDAWVPADVDALLRVDAAGIVRAPAVRTLWDGPAGRRVRDEFGLDEELDAAKRADAELAGLPMFGGEPPTLGRDLLGGEALVALRGEDLLLLTRITPRAKAIDLLRRVREERREEWGIRVDGDAYAATLGDGRDVRFARRRDVMMVSTSKELLASALALADGGGGSIAADADYRAAQPASASGAKAGAWIAGRFLVRTVKTPAVVAKLLAPAFARGVAVDVDASKADAVAAQIRFVRGDADLVDVGFVAQCAREVLSRERTFAAGSLPFSARDAVEALVDSQPPARRELVANLLAESGSSVDAVVADLSRHLAPGVGFVVARLPETDRLKLDDADGDPVEPIPATVAVFRLADADAEPFLADLRRHAADLFGDDARLVESAENGGGRWFVADATSFGPEWAMLRPAIVVRGRTVVFSSNEAYLRRGHEDEITRFHTPPRSVADLAIDVPNLMKRLDDLRWETADRATWRDWAAERAEVREDLARRFPSMPVRDRERREDDEIARRIAERKQRLFPEAVRAYRESLRWLAAFRSVDARATSGGDVVRVDATIGLSVP
jgi:hypothetical protein